jgi:hypothetical protein
MKKQLADHHVAPNSTSGSDEEEDDDEEENVEQSFNGQSGTSFKSTLTAAVFSRFTEMSSQFAEVMEMHRKQKLKPKIKTARGAISFDSPPKEPPHKLKSPFKPTRSAADMIGVMQADEDLERDSLASKSPRTTARIRLQEKYVKVTKLYKDECSPEEINERIREIVFNAMVKSAIYEDLDSADRAYGGLKKKCTACPYFISA